MGFSFDSAQLPSFDSAQLPSFDSAGFDSAQPAGTIVIITFPKKGLSTSWDYCYYYLSKEGPLNQLGLLLLLSFLRRAAQPAGSIVIITFPEKEHLVWEKSSA
jgi:hypothetical protein